ncbi:MAG: hypothetical protein PUJ43_02895 [Bacillales bacterium]|nr:hypothetical protein [Bacillales bacterium]MDY5919827.1 hypothetical protein [Candidatus Enteromonas sp.]
MIRQRLRDIDLKITELADYLGITRPTLYKFIDSYDAGNFDSINKKVLDLFNYIEKNPLAGRNTILNYILNHLVLIKEMGEESDVALYNKVKRFLMENPEASKSRFIEEIISKDTFDSVIDYLLTIEPLLKKKRLSEKEKTQVEPYIQLQKALKGASENGTKA